MFALLVVGLALALPPAASADEAVPPPRLDEATAVEVALAEPGVARWLRRYPRDPTTSATFDTERRKWTVRAWSGQAGQIVEAVVDDRTRAVTEAWVGPQVAWKMARGRPGAFGGKTITSWPVWAALSALFFLGLADLRRLWRLRNLDLLVLLSFGVSLAFFNSGRVFASSALAVPPLLYLCLRTLAIGFRVRPSEPVTPVWPVWLVAAATLFLVGFRLGLDVQQPHGVTDVGYAGVIGADRILDGRSPWGAFPQRTGAECGPRTVEGERRDRIQPDGRCETPNPRGDTYGPVAYLSYVPAVVALGWSGRWDSLPAAHAVSIAFDLLTLLGLVVLGARLGGTRLAATLAFAWAAYPFTAYALLSTTNDALVPAFLVWGLVVATSPAGRGLAVALSGWSKFVSLPTIPLWLTYPDGPTRHGVARFGVAFLAASVAVFAVLLLDPSLGAALRTFWDRTLGFQLGRDSPFSIWGWGQYHASGLPDLAIVQRGVQVAAIALAVLVAFRPRYKGPRELAALTAAVLLAVQLSLTHWFYLYLPWMLPFVVCALLLRPRERVAD